MLDIPKCQAHLWIQLQRIVQCSYYLHYYHLKNAILCDPCETYIEVGCGAGAFVSFLEKHVNIKKYTGIDLDADQIIYAKERYGDPPRIEFFVRDVANLNLDENYECLIIVGLIHHISDDTCLKFIESLRPIVTKKIIILEPVFDRNTLIARIYRGYFERGKYKRTLSELQVLLEKMGLDIISNKLSHQPFRLFEFWSAVAKFKR